MAANAFEQLMIELINRARLDPLGEAARLGITDPAGIEALSLPEGSLGVLASATELENSATAHSDWMLAHDTFSHTGVNGSDAGTRMASAGYDFTGSWYWGENIGYRASSGTIDQNAAVHHIHEALFMSDGHRRNMLNDVFREVGVATENGDFYGYDTVMITQNYATSANRTFLTGVVYNDLDRDGFYSVGEGVGGVRFSIGGLSANTHAAGGYAIENVLTGPQTVTITYSGRAFDVIVDTGAGNVKLDVVNGGLVQSDSNLELASGAVHARLLGTRDLTLAGNDADNRLYGNSGDNQVTGGRGNDILYGEDGDDTLAGQSGDDTIDGGAGHDTAIINTRFSEVKVTEKNGEIHISSTDGNDVFVNVEEFIFSDRVLFVTSERVFDVDSLLSASLKSGQAFDAGEPGTMTGSDEADTFVFAEDFGAAVVNGYEKGTDRLQFDSALWAESLTVSEVVARFATDTGPDIVFDFGSGNAVTLTGVTEIAGIESDLLIV